MLDSRVSCCINVSKYGKRKIDFLFPFSLFFLCLLYSNYIILVNSGHNSSIHCYRLATMAGKLGGRKESRIVR